MMQDRNHINYALLTVTLYGIAMAYLETAVVIYLRELYYPGGFNFPMKSMPDNITLTEILREAATMIMLMTIGMLAGKKLKDRIAWFIYCFAIWDIFYYIFLKLMIDWPSSLMTWDILFLLPVIWSGPVITPVIVSLIMILFALQLLTNDHPMPFIRKNLLFLVSGTLLLFLAFIWDFSKYMLQQYSFTDLFVSRTNQIALQQYIPQIFNWWLFIFGSLLVIVPLALRVFKIDSKKRDA
jgi:hypothetical protein